MSPSRWSRLWLAAFAASGYAFLAVTAVLLLVSFHGGRIVSVQTNSMTPTFKAGDALLIQHVTAKSLKLGDVITYRSSQDPSHTISHRIVARKNGGFLTAGDRQHRLDPLVLPGQITGRAWAVAPGLGRVINWLHSRIGLVTALFIPAALIIVSEIWNLSRVMFRPVYRLCSSA
jgi:signal peptidase